ASTSMAGSSSSITTHFIISVGVYGQLKSIEHFFIGCFDPVAVLKYRIKPLHEIGYAYAMGRKLNIIFLSFIATKKIYLACTQFHLYLNGVRGIFSIAVFKGIFNYRYHTKRRYKLSLHLAFHAIIYSMYM